MEAEGSSGLWAGSALVDTGAITAVGRALQLQALARDAGASSLSHVGPGNRWGIDDCVHLRPQRHLLPVPGALARYRSLARRQALTRETSALEGAIVICAIGWHIAVEAPRRAGPLLAR